MSLKDKYTKIVKSEAKRLGFFACGISKARFLEEEATSLENWLSEDKYGEMYYMQNNFDKRLDPTLLVEGSKSVISLLLPYYPTELQKNKDAPVISKYAYGKDYHFVIKEKLKEFYGTLKKEIGDVSARFFTDSAPILERKWAELSGLGWIGKNGNLITKNGSFFFISEIIIDIELEYDSPITSLCGNCTRCINACPTQALSEPYKVDANKCISYLTIEFKKEIPDEFIGKFQNRFFGCDICQDVCPHNRKPILTNEEWFKPHEKLLEITESEFYEITQDIYTEIFRKSAVKRTKFSGVKRNLEFLQKK